MEWFTRGDMEATAASELVGISVDAIRDLMQINDVRSLMRSYQSAYADLCMSLAPELLSDLESPVEHSMVVITMETSARVSAAEPVLDVLQQRQRRQWLQTKDVKGLAELEEE